MAKAPSARTQAKPGAVLKALRADRGWTLAEVGRKTGLTVSALSKIENDKVALTYEKLLQISEGLQIDIAELFGSPNVEAASPHAASRRSITRGGDGRSIELDHGAYLYVAADLLKKRMTPIIGEVFTRSISDYPGFLKHSGEEYVYVVEGVLDLYTDTYTPVRLEQGDSIYFDSSMGHAYVAVGEAPCRILSICASAEGGGLPDFQASDPDTLEYLPSPQAKLAGVSRDEAPRLNDKPQVKRRKAG